MFAKVGRRGHAARTYSAYWQTIVIRLLRNRKQPQWRLLSH